MTGSLVFVFEFDTPDTMDSCPRSRILVPKFPSFKVLGARGAGMAERTGNQMSRRVKLAALFFYHAETLERLNSY